MITTEQRQSIKATPITSYLAGKGILPVLESNGEYCYFSPFREEKTPSFFVNPGKNLFIDFADGYGGDVIKLVMTLEAVDFIAAIKILQQVDRSFEIELRQNLPASPQYQSFIKRITPLQHPALVNYITKERGIPLSVAKSELSEVHYRTSRGEFFSLGFKNLSDGWELRNPSFKGSIGQKDISVRGNPSGRYAVILEGFIDYLSLLVRHQKTLAIRGDQYCFYILNSLSLIRRLPDLERFEMVSLYLDNDREGEKAALLLTEKYCNSFNHSKFLFPDKKDFNEYLISKL